MRFKNLKLNTKKMYRTIKRGNNEEVSVEEYHYQLEMNVIDKSTGFIYGRPWITSGIDVHSRLICCMNVSLENPLQNS